MNEKTVKRVDKQSINFKHLRTAQGLSTNTRYKNKHKRRMRKAKYRGQGR